MGCNCVNQPEVSICEDLFFVGAASPNTPYLVVLEDLAVGKEWRFQVVSNGGGGIFVDLSTSRIVPNRTYELTLLLNGVSVSFTRNVSSNCFWIQFDSVPADLLCPLLDEEFAELSDELGFTLSSFGECEPNPIDPLAILDESGEPILDELNNQILAP